MLQLTQYAQNEWFGSVFKSLSENFADSLEEIIKQLTSQHTLSEAEQKNLADLRSLLCLRSYVSAEGIHRIEGRLEKAALPTDERFPIVLPSRHPFTRLLVLHCHERCAHGGTRYTLMLTRRQF